MKLINSTDVQFDKDTFAPVVDLTFRVTLDSMQDGVRLLGEDEMALAIGKEFIAALKSIKTFTKQGQA